MSDGGPPYPALTAEELGLTDEEMLDGLVKDLRERGIFRGQVVDAACHYQADAVERALRRMKAHATALAVVEAARELFLHSHRQIVRLYWQHGYQEHDALAQSLATFDAARNPNQKGK